MHVKTSHHGHTAVWLQMLGSTVLEALQGGSKHLLLTVELGLCCNPLHILLCVILEATPLAVDALGITPQQ